MTTKWTLTHGYFVIKTNIVWYEIHFEQMKNYAVRHIVTMEEVFEVSVADDDDDDGESNCDNSSSGNNIRFIASLLLENLLVMTAIVQICINTLPEFSKEQKRYF